MLFHKDVFMPKGLQKDVFNSVKEIDCFEWKLSQHLFEHFMHPNKKHTIDIRLLYKAIRDLNTLPIEIELNETGKFRKALFRMPYKKNIDISFILAFRDNKDKKQRKIITCYINDITDNHTTLDHKRYMTEKEYIKWQKRK